MDIAASSLLLVPPFGTTWSFSANPPPSQNGIHSTGSEFLTIGFNGNIGAVLNALNTGTVRVGIHDIAFADGGSLGAILVPEPGTMALTGTALLAMGGVARRHGDRHD
ncbi:MAG TPA: PEP-CTERM sorting domain-containing protein [Burkholderiales bacterium]|nr:PEP-CTERM sorting domain-containing protein [Burkholderiales bacterium]